MKAFKIYVLIGLFVLSLVSCNDFLNTVPHDAMSPSTTWKTEDDANKFVVGCYDGFEDGGNLFYLDAGSDFAYNNFPWEGFKAIGNGSFSPGNPGGTFYDYTTIHKCNTFLENVNKCTFTDDAIKKDLIAQVKTIRAYEYFRLGWIYGGVPIIGNYTNADEAKVPRNTLDEVKAYIFKDLNSALDSINTEPSARGRIAKGAVLAIKMRASLYWGDYKTAKESAQSIIDLGQYSLEPNYSNLFTVAGQDSKEIILAVQYITGTKSLYTTGQLYNNGDGGWSSVVPTQNCVDNYEMANGLTINEAGSGYDAIHPFYGRDPRMAMSIAFPGCDWIDSKGTSEIFNTLDATIKGVNNPDYPATSDNSSKTSLTWRKYLYPITQYSDMFDTNCCPIIFRYAEVLLTWAEAENELNGPSSEVYNKINKIRERAGMPDVDQSKYNTKEKLRQLIRRERGAEFAGEGLRRADIIRWTDTDGKMVAEKVLNGELDRIIGTVDYSQSDPTMRAKITGTVKVEDRAFHAYNKLFPIPQTDIDNNPKLTQNPGYSN